MAATAARNKRSRTLVDEEEEVRFAAPMACLRATHRHSMPARPHSARTRDASGTDALVAGARTAGAHTGVLC